MLLNTTKLELTANKGEYEREKCKVNILQMYLHNIVILKTRLKKKHTF